MASVQHIEPERQQKLVELFFRLLPATFGLVVLATYLLFTTDHLGGADSAELIGASYNWGIAHPPGYPLYITLGKLFSLISPFANVIYTYNLFATICSLTAFVLLYRGLRHVGIQPAALVMAGSFFIFSPISMRWLTTAEVFGLHLLICAAGIYLVFYTIHKERLTQAARLLGLVVGLGAANHHTIIFLFPGFFLVYGYYWLRLDSRRRLQELAWLGLFTVLGFSFYLQPVISTRLFEPPVSAMGISIHSFQDLTDLFLRKLYGPFSPTGKENATAPYPWFWLNRYLVTGIFSEKGLTIFIGMLCCYQIVRSMLSRCNLLHSFILLCFFSSLSFFLMVDYPTPENFELDILARMFLMPSMIATLLAILGLDLLLKDMHLVGSRMHSLLALSTMIFLLGTLLNGERQVNTAPLDIELQTGRDILTGCTENSLLLLSADSHIFSTFYLQEVEGMRKDICTIAWPLTTLAQYRAFLATRWGNKIGLQKTTTDQATRTYDANTTLPNDENTSTEWLSVLLKNGIDVFADQGIHSLLETETSDEHVVEKLASLPRGIIWQVVEAPAPTGREEILLANLPAIQSYLAWLPAGHWPGQYEPERRLLERYFTYLRLMRMHQFKADNQVIPADLLEKICLLTRSAVPDDQLADLFLGVFYSRYALNPSLAVSYLDNFLKNYTGQQEEPVETAKALHNRLLMEYSRSPDRPTAAP